MSSDRHGFGILTWKDGSSYSGQFVRNNFHGYAFERYADGGVFVGQFKDSVRHGLGQYTMTAVRSYSGQWDKGAQHGVGIEVQVRLFISLQQKLYITATDSICGCNRLCM